MTSPTSPSPAGPTDDPGRRRRRWLMFGGITVVVLAVVAFAGWYFILRDTSPAGVNTDEQAAARAQALAEVEAESEADPAPPEGIDGTWAVDTTIGDFGDFSSTFAGFRIDEELASIGANTVVGRTPDVSGTLEIDGTTITGTDIVVNMQTLTTDSDSRDRQLRGQAIETDTFPEATFTLTEPIELGSVPPEGETVEVTATGELTVHGVTNVVDIPLTAELNNGIVVVVGEANLLLSDYDIDKPTAAAVLSVADNADLELQLFFSR